jgi:nucleotide-binding universal stress UspA family protein
LGAAAVDDGENSPKCTPLTCFEKEIAMLPSIRKILFATDLSDNCASTLDYAVSMAEKYHARLMVLHVLEPVTSNPYLQLKGFKSDKEWQSLERDKQEKLKHILEAGLKDLCREINDRLSACQIPDDHILLEEGVPVEVILQVARKNQADLIVIGTHGYGIVKDALMGGTARRVLRRSTLPVLVVHSGGS